MKRLNEIISRLRYVKSGDIVASADHNDLVDAVKEIRKAIGSWLIGPSGINPLDLLSLPEVIEGIRSPALPCVSYFDHYLIDVKPLPFPSHYKPNSFFSYTSLLYDFHLAGVDDKAVDYISSKLTSFHLPLFAMQVNYDVNYFSFMTAMKVLNNYTDGAKYYLGAFYTFSAEHGVYSKITLYYAGNNKIVLYDTIADKYVDMYFPSDDWFILEFTNYCEARKAYIAIFTKDLSLYSSYELAFAEEKIEQPSIMYEFYHCSVEENRKAMWRSIHDFTRIEMY